MTLDTRGVAVAIFIACQASNAMAQTGPHGYAGAGLGASQCASGCPPGQQPYERVALLGGGFAYPIWPARMWIAGDLNSRVSDGYFDASGGPAVVVALAATATHRLETFAQGGPRWGDGGNVRWNVGAGANVWAHPRIGVRLEYQYQWRNTKLIDQPFGPSGPIGPPAVSDLTLSDHFIRVALAVR